MSGGLPGLTRLDHVGFTVPDLEEASRFLVDVLGCEYMYTLGPFRHDDSDWMLEHLNVDPRAVMRELHFFRCGGQAVFEVFEYAADRTIPCESALDLRSPWTFPAASVSAVELTTEPV